MLLSIPLLKFLVMWCLAKFSNLGAVKESWCWGDDPRYAKGMPNRMVKAIKIPV
jgi:hypothetical protein